MPFIYKSGDMFSQPADAIINTINCVGVMGKGVALQFKNRWPENYKAYKAACNKNEVKPGIMFTFQNGDMFTTDDYKYLINFPTKEHWRSKSKVEHIESGLMDLARIIDFYDIKSVCIPPLGCGNGGLDWQIVKPMISKALEEQSLDRNIFIFEPIESSITPEFAPLSIPMTYHRALLFRVLGDFENYFGGGYTKLSLQKIVYFLQILEADFGMKFEKNIYGPYSTDLARVLIKIANADGFINTDSESNTVTVSAAAYAYASEYLSENSIDSANEATKKLSNLISGYESPFGLELLSSVHFLSDSKAIDTESIVNALHTWSDRKRSLFSKEVIYSAIKRLKSDGLIA